MAKVLKPWLEYFSCILLAVVYKIYDIISRACKMDQHGLQRLCRQPKFILNSESKYDKFNPKAFKITQKSLEHET